MSAGTLEKQGNCDLTIAVYACPGIGPGREAQEGAVGQTADAIVVGFAKSALLTEQSLAPLRALRQRGVLRSLHYVTWDSPEIDGYIAPVLNMPDVQITRVPQPQVDGEMSVQKNFVYQIRNLEAALSLIPDDDALVLKWRTDIVANPDFIADKIACFDLDCEIDRDAKPLGVTMPEPVLRNKIWIPWADSNQPFFYEDAAFLGRKADLRKLVTPYTRADIKMLADPLCNHYCHIVRFARIFLPSYPIFANYLKHYRHITNEQVYRTKLMPHLLQSGYFLFLLIAHAWILYNQFHVDCGEQGDLMFYPNQSNTKTDWSKPETWRVAYPYDSVVGWQRTTVPGHFAPNAGRPFGRLVDEQWQTALFTKGVVDIPPGPLKGLLEHSAHFGDGRLAGIERD